MNGAKITNNSKCNKYFCINFGIVLYFSYLCMRNRNTLFIIYYATKNRWNSIKNGFERSPTYIRAPARRYWV